MVKLTSRVRPKDVPLQMHPLALHIGLCWDVLRTSGRFMGTHSGGLRDVIKWVVINMSTNTFQKSYFCPHTFEIYFDIPDKVKDKDNTLIKRFLIIQL